MVTQYRKFATTTLLLLACSLSAQKPVDRSEEQARQIVDSVYTKLIEGTDFGLLVSRYSEDPGSNKEGGMYQNAEFGSFVPEFETVVSSLKPYEISKPFRTEYGFHIVQLISRSERTFTVRHILIRV